MEEVVPGKRVDESSVGRLFLFCELLLIVNFTLTQQQTVNRSFSGAWVIESGAQGTTAPVDWGLASLLFLSEGY